MKLSEAIRLGSMLRPQGFGGLFINGKSCALGAAAEAIGANANGHLDTWGSALYDTWPDMFGHCGMVPHPITQHVSRLQSIVHDLNDERKWTREQIADWVAQVEPSETPDAIIGQDDKRGTTEIGQPVLAIRGSDR